MNLWQRWRKTTIANQALVATSIMVAFGTLFYAAAAGWQVFLMNKSAASTERQIQDAINAINRIATSTDQANAKNRQAIDEMLAKMHGKATRWIARIE